MTKTEFHRAPAGPGPKEQRSLCHPRMEGRHIAIVPTIVKF